MIAQDFHLLDQYGKLHDLSTYKGTWVILYFYPKDNTPLCTKEACEFRDAQALFKEKNVVVMGVSMDTVETHRHFSDKFHIKFPLLSDESGLTAKAYDAWAPSLIPGFSPIKRITYLINPQGEIAKKYEKVNPLVHVKEILEDLKEFSKEQ